MLHLIFFVVVWSSSFAGVELMVCIFAKYLHRYLAVFIYVLPFKSKLQIEVEILGTRAFIFSWFVAWDSVFTITGPGEINPSHATHGTWDTGNTLSTSALSAGR